MQRKKHKGSIEIRTPDGRLLNRTVTSIVCLIAVRIQQAERQRSTPQAKPSKTTARCGCSLGAAVAKRRTPVDF
jgi:gamma-glutamyl:cysteine ligase YbdK (ATP-grasp superfamily)